ncbi:hypothetical protein F5Y15DRAFT_45348 [Xylariaceae sp. FL0016]|nr:hypothetical protein F5Y15DRAFT_45348 [Xylariaceae sp. FL0016]
MFATMNILSFLSLMAVGALAVDHCPAVCVSDPPLLLDAGVTNVSASIDADYNTQCQATLQFSNTDFLPVSYRFHFDDSPCNGLMVASFTVPNEAPNGMGCVMWQCTGLGMQSCNTFTISGGLAEENLTATGIGYIGCVQENTKTSTTLRTVTSASRTLTETSTSTLISLTTSLFQDKSDATNLESGQGSGLSFGDASTRASTTNSSVDTTASTSVSTGISEANATATSQQTADVIKGGETSITTADVATASSGVESVAATSLMTVVISSVMSSFTVLQTVTSVMTACSEETNV